MPFGKSVRIFLPDATVTGMRHAEILNRTGQAIACPRSRLEELKNWQEASRPGVYFLFEARLGDSKPSVYVGESENVAERLLHHDRKKEFWNDAVIFSSKDDNLSKAHIKYLESRLESVATSADRYKVENGNSPTQSTLPRAEREAMEELLEDIRLVLGTLGYPVLEPLIPKQTPTPTSLALAQTLAASSEELTFTVHKLVAHGVLTDEGFVLKKGSTASKTTWDSLSTKLVKFKDQLISDGRMLDEVDHYRLAEDVLMSSSSYAAALIAGTARSGPQSWYDASGKSLKELEDIAINASSSEQSEGGV